MWMFDRLCGENISLDNNCTTAKRQHPIDTYGYGICFTNTPLVICEVFEIQVDKIVTKWNSAVCLGVTTHKPHNLTKIGYGLLLKESWLLHGSSLWENGNDIGPYSLKINDVQVGDKLGMMIAPDSTHNFYLNGIDNGKAFCNLPEDVYGVVDVYGNCCEVSIINQATEAQVAIKKAPTFSGRPVEWNVQTVCDFIESIPECAPYVAKFQSERINGAALLELDKKDLKDFFEMPLGLAVNVCSHLKKYEEKKNR
ncbi:NEURL4 [Mytilus edulis]|uniref:NEURL4 n=1 Tax=Mytilus edulis TaxID=6550 RepID=A0A8S3U6Y4_MYTED|nr:NEURL4 [Mytilus edulis]